MRQRADHWNKLTDPAISWQIRADFLRHPVDGNLSGEDANILLNLLSHRPDARDAESWWVVTNEIMVRLATNNAACPRFAATLLSIIQDSGSPEVLRDYAIQHLGQWINPNEKDLATVPRDSETVGRILGALVAVVRDPSLADTSIPGTTLMVFSDLKSKGFAHPAFLTGITGLQDWITGVIRGDLPVNMITRTSAINAAGQLALRDQLPAIRALAFSSASAPTIRLNAIAALGGLGNSEDLPELKKIAGSSSRFRPAALAAYRRISSL